MPPKPPRSEYPIWIYIYYWDMWLYIFIDVLMIFTHASCFSDLSFSFHLSTKKSKKNIHTILNRQTTRKISMMMMKLYNLVWFSRKLIDIRPHLTTTTTYDYSWRRLRPPSFFHHWKWNPSIARPPRWSSATSSTQTHPDRRLRRGPLPIFDHCHLRLNCRWSAENYRNVLFRYPTARLQPIKL